MEIDKKWLLKCGELADQAVRDGKHPFAAILVKDDTLLMTQGNISTVEHAESTLARLAFGKYSPEFLWKCTLYTTAEPCCMCSGTIYWANIGTVVYSMSEARLLEFTGNHSENPTMSLGVEEVLSRGQKPIQVRQLELVELEAAHEFWK